MSRLSRPHTCCALRKYCWRGWRVRASRFIDSLCERFVCVCVCACIRVGTDVYSGVRGVCASAFRSRTLRFGRPSSLLLQRRAHASVTIDDVNPVLQPPRKACRRCSSVYSVCPYENADAEASGVTAPRRIFFHAFLLFFFVCLRHGKGPLRRRRHFFPRRTPSVRVAAGNCDLRDVSVLPHSPSLSSRP